MKAIERIAGYACEINEDQWRELVKVADEVGAQPLIGGGLLVWTYNEVNDEIEPIMID